MSRLNDYYSNIRMSTSAEDMAERVTAASKEKQPKRIAFKRPVIAAAAAAVVLVGGVTAGAATGLFNFNEIFHSVEAETPQLNESLPGLVKDYSCKVSDDDYVVSLSGVSGSPASLMANFKVARADGQPIAYDPANGVDVDVDITLNDGDGFTGGGMHYGVNDDGVVDIDWQTRLRYSDLIEGRVMVGGEMNVSGSVSFIDGSERKTVDWEMTFDYTPSEQSLKVKKAADLSDNCSIFTTLGKDDDDEQLLSQECSLSALTLTSTMGIMKSNLSSDNFNNICLTEQNEIRLIKKNGEQLIGMIIGMIGTEENDTYFTIDYYNSYLTKEIAIDLDEIEAISINGTVYEVA